MPALLRIILAALSLSATKPQPRINYSLTISPTDPTSINVWMQVSDAPRSFRIAMAVHPEYNDRYWRYIRDLHADGGDRRVVLATDKENVWRIISHSGAANIYYRIQLPPENPRNHPVWHTAIRPDGGSINSLDTFLYLPDFPHASVRLRLSLPSRRLAYAVPGGGIVEATAGGYSYREFETDTETLLDSPIMYGDGIRWWRFQIADVPVGVAYLPLPNAAPFDTAQFIDAIKKVATEAANVFGGKPPFPHYTFLIQDGAWGALEHANSVTLGMPSADLARDPRAYLGELAHELFHSWNLVRLYPEGRGGLSEKPPEHATGLWLSEGVTTLYADVLTRRAGFPDEGLSRADWLARELETYYGNPGNFVVSPEVASARAVDSTGINGDLGPNYYSQGRVIGTALDIAIRDSTRGKRGLDDLMRALYTQFAMKRGFTTDDVEQTASKVCSCNLRSFFDDYVRSARPVNMNRFLRSVGLRATVDTVPAADSTGARFADLRVWAYPPRSGGRMRVIIQDPSSVWARAGLHTGDEIASFNGAPVDSFPDFRRVVRGIKLGDTVAVSIVRRGKPALVRVRVTGYDRARVRIDELPGASPEQVERRRFWLAASPNG